MSSDFLRIEMGKALHGDCLFVEWGGANGKHRMLIDGGPIGAYEALATRIAALPADEHSFELIVLSHVDTDHIEGVVRLFAEPATQWPFQVKNVWFNGWRHMDEEDTLGGRQGEFFSALLQHRPPPGAWNGAFKGAVVVAPTGPLPVVPLAGGMNLTLLSPTRAKLDKMREAWRKDLKTNGIKPGDIDARMIFGRFWAIQKRHDGQCVWPAWSPRLVSTWDEIERIHLIGAELRSGIYDDRTGNRRGQIRWDAQGYPAAIQ
jgi:hypothetical protein